MKVLKELKTVILVAGIILCLVLWKVLKKKDFPGNVNTLIEATLKGTNRISAIDGIVGKYTLINLDTEPPSFDNQNFTTLNIPFSTLTEKENLEQIRNTGTAIVIYSHSPAVSSKAWVILNQMGIGNLFILDMTEDVVFKHKFLPDTIK